jgi:threonine aldolase
MARRLAELMPFPLAHAVEANAVFVEMDEPTLRRLHAAGWFVYRFIDGSVRFMCNWSTTVEMVEEIGATLKAL